MVPPSAPPLGLIAGQGALPIAVARAARESGRRVVAIAFEGFADKALEEVVDRLVWVYVGQVEALLGALAESGAREIAVVGGVRKAELFARSELIRPDARALALLASLRELGDDSILRTVGRVIEEAGFEILRQDQVAPALLAPEGAIASLVPSDEQREEIRFAWPRAKALGALDIGQTLVVRQRTVLAVEAIEGTDEAIRRGAKWGEGDGLPRDGGAAGVSVIKVLKPNQDLRFDFPTVGPETARVLAECGATLLAVEAGRTLILEREVVSEIADRAGLCLVGVSGDEHPRV